jgi:hypothetical protein
MPVKSTHIDQASLRALLEATDNAAISIAAAWRVAIKAGGERWLAIAQEAIGLTDHTQDDLDDLDNPYARRHGSIQLHQGWALHMQDSRNRVHEQSGDMMRALSGQFEDDAEVPRYRVALDPTVPEVRFVLKGTPSMLPRDPLASAALAPQTQEDVRAVITSRMSRRFGTNARVRFS